MVRMRFDVKKISVPQIKAYIEDEHDAKIGYAKDGAKSLSRDEGRHEKFWRKQLKVKLKLQKEQKQK